MRLRTLSVTEVTLYLKRILGGDPILSHISIQGEVSNLKHHSSGHLYFTLKDEHSRLQCVMFQGDAQHLRFVPSDGMAVVVKGQVTVYDQDRAQPNREGRYQLYARHMEPAGLGDLFARFEALKARLEAQGYFRPERKKPIPRYTERIGVVTSADSAAWRDIQSVLARRNDAVRVVLCPAAVQGPQAASELSQALKTLDAMDLDVLILARGGGSIEELWAFNEEVLAVTLRHLKTPVISGVGHETDFTIADFTADLRAATPSAAAELAVQDKQVLREALGQTLRKLSSAVLRRVAAEERRLDRAEPRRLSQQLMHRMALRQGELEALMMRQRETARTELQNRLHRLQLDAQRLDAASPLRILAQGYALVTEAQGSRISSVSAVHSGQLLNVRVQDGTFDCRVESSSQGDS